jgi:hypothetical protein
MLPNATFQPISNSLREKDKGKVDGLFEEEI